MAPRRKSNRARKLDDDEDDETSEYPMDVDSESGDMDELPEDVDEDEDLMEEAVNEEEEEEEEPTAGGSSPQRKKPKTSSTGPKKVKLTPYQKREDDFIDEKGEAKVTKDGELVGGTFSWRLRNTPTKRP